MIAYFNQLRDGLRVSVGDCGHLLRSPVHALGDDGVLLRAEVLLLVHVGRDEAYELAGLAGVVVAIAGR